MPGFLLPFPRICGNYFVVFYLWPNQISCIFIWILFVLKFYLRWFLLLYFPLPPVLVVLSGPFLLGQLALMSLCGSFQIIPPNSASVADSITFLITLHSTCNGPFYRYINCIGVFDFGTRKNTHLLFFVPLVLICRMHPNIYGESFHFFCIMLLHLYVNCCNLKIDWYILWYLLLYLSVPPPVILLPLTL